MKSHCVQLYTGPIRPFIYWHTKERYKSRQPASTRALVMNSSSQQHMDLLLSLINVKLFNSFDGRPSASAIVFLFTFHSFCLVFALTCFHSHLLPFSCPFCFPNTCVCVGSPRPCQGTHGEVIGMGSLWASNHEINMDGHE